MPRSLNSTRRIPRSADCEMQPCPTPTRFCKSCLMNEVRIGNAPGDVLVISDPVFEGTEITQVTAHIQGENLTASVSAYNGYQGGFEDLVRFFDSLETDWRGWTGERSYECIEGQLRITATHNGHVQLAVRLRETTDPEGWTVFANVQLDPGEALSNATRGLRALIADRYTRVQ